MREPRRVPVIGGEKWAGGRPDLRRGDDGAGLFGEVVSAVDMLPSYQGLANAPASVSTPRAALRPADLLAVADFDHFEPRPPAVHDEFINWMVETHTCRL